MKWTTSIVSIIVILVIIVTAISTFYVTGGNRLTVTTTTETTVTTTYTISNSTTSLTTLPTVFVFGLMSTTGQGTCHTLIVFRSINSGQVFTIPIANGHSFSVRLPNNDVYNVTTFWNGMYYWQNGTIDKGTLTLNWGPGSKAAQSFNVVDDTPNSLVNLSGTAQITSNPQIKPLAVRFTASNGLLFEIPTTVNGTFSFQIPNMMNYSASIRVQYVNGTFGYCNSGNMLVNEPPGVSNATRDITC